MLKSALLCASLSASGVGWAQSFTSQGTVLDSSAAAFTGNGAGSATVSWDGALGRFVMFFESRLTGATATCPAGEWGIGVASSVDGSSWDVYPDLAVAPTPGTPYSCFAAQPSALKTPTGDWHIWFQAGQRSDACASGTPAWGCDQVVGIAHVEGVVDLGDKSADIAADEALLLELEADRAAVLAAWASSLQTLNATLSNELQCVDYDAYCTPCLSWASSPGVTTGNSATVSKTFCQPFSFAFPNSLDVVQGSAGQSGQARIVSGGSTCKFKGDKDQDDYLRLLGQCDADPVLVDEVTVIIQSPKVKPLLIDLVINATNGDSQSLQGSTAVLLADAITAAQNGDVAAATSLATQLDSALLNIIVNTAPSDATAAAARVNIADVLSDLTFLAGEIADAEQRILDNSFYEEFVSLDGPGNASVQWPRAGFPDVVLSNGVYHMLVARTGNIYHGTSTDGDFWSFDFTNPVMAKGGAAWSQSELFSPSTICESNGSLINIIGGRQTNLNIPGASILLGGLSTAFSSDFVTWAITSTPLATFTTATDYRQWDAIRSGSSYRLYTTEIDAQGRPRIRLETDGGTFTASATRSHSCD